MKALIVASFGTTHGMARRQTLEKIERQLKHDFPGVDVFSTYTSAMVRNVLERRDGLIIPAPDELTKELLDRGYATVVILPTHLIAGIEYKKLKSLEGENVVVQRPLLNDSEDLLKLARILKSITNEDDGALVFVGHGSEDRAALAYLALEDVLKEEIGPNAFLVNLESYPKLSDRIEKIQSYDKATVIPLMIVSGEHVLWDVIESPDSVKNTLEAAGLEVDVKAKGLGAYKKIRDLFSGRVGEILNG